LTLARGRRTADPSSAASPLRFWGSALVLAAMPGIAHAQLAGSVAVATSEMFRGETISDSHPVLTVGVSLDSGSGLFAGASGSVADYADGPRIASLVQYAGYARRFGAISAEVGLVHRSYNRVVDTGYRRAFFEGYAGIAYRGIRARFYLSPDYLVAGRNSYYTEVNARLLKVKDWSLEGHGGLSLIPHDSDTGRQGLRHFHDWRLQASRPIGPVFVAIGVNATNYPVYSTSGRARAFASISTAF